MNNKEILHQSPSFPLSPFAVDPTTRLFTSDWRLHQQRARRDHWRVTVAWHSKSSCKTAERLCKFTYRQTQIPHDYSCNLRHRSHLLVRYEDAVLYFVPPCIGESAPMLLRCHISCSGDRSESGIPCRPSFCSLQSSPSGSREQRFYSTYMQCLRLTAALSSFSFTSSPSSVPPGQPSRKRGLSCPRPA